MGECGRSTAGSPFSLITALCRSKPGTEARSARSATRRLGQQDFYRYGSMQADFDSDALSAYDCC